MFQGSSFQIDRKELKKIIHKFIRLSHKVPTETDRVEVFITASGIRATICNEAGEYICPDFHILGGFPD